MMAEPKTIPARSTIADQYKWNAESVFPSRAVWEAEFKTVGEALGELAPFQGQLGESAGKLADWLELSTSLVRRVSKLFFYARMSQSVDTGDEEATGMTGQAFGLYARVGAATAFSNPEILAIGEDKLKQWVTSESRLSQYAQYFDDLFRQQKHVRSPEVEELLAMAGEPFGQTDNTADMLTDADMQFKPVTVDGKEMPLAQSTIDTFLDGGDRDARKQAWENYADTYLSLKNTLTSNYLASVKRDVFYARARNYGTALEASLFQNNIQKEVFHNLIDTFRKNIPTWHKYWAIRRKALGVETLEPYDIWAPISKKPPVVSYEQAVQWIAEGMAPLGKDYVAALRNGCLEDRWVDVYPSQGKSAGAFSYGTYDTMPFIMMSFDDSLGAMSTLAHELGHSMHSYLSRKNQPYVYGDYSLFVAEVASNFNQAMTRAHLFKVNSDADFQIALIEEAMSNLHRYFFIMPTLARFELEVHTRIEDGKAVTAGDLIGLMTDLFTEGYGSEMHVDRDRVGITWAQFGHLYANYYVFQYATGISAAHELAGRIQAGESGAAENYVKFLSSGSSLYPVDALKLAGVDMSTPAAVEATFEVLAGYVDKLGELTS
ncbi:MAG: oligoendopeptidase F [Chloroflexi bacterium]|nr:oligoendopeptidase F [Chloroflexota bacterium]